MRLVPIIITSATSKFENDHQRGALTSIVAQRKLWRSIMYSFQPFLRSATMLVSFQPAIL